MKKMAKAVLFFALAGTLLAGCSEQPWPHPSSLQEETRTKVGMLPFLNVSEERLNELRKNVEADISPSLNLSREFVYYDNLMTLQAALESDKVHCIALYSNVAKYLTDRNAKFKVVEENPGSAKRPVDDICFAVRQEAQELKESLDQAVREMKADGTLERLEKDYITDLGPCEDPSIVPIQEIPGADSVSVAVTGDLPPFDLVLANGKAAGFNTAVLAELGERLGKNIEIIQVDSAARVSALMSGQADVVFWSVLPVEGDMPKDLDQPDGVELTLPYFRDEIVHVEKK